MSGFGRDWDMTAKDEADAEEKEWLRDEVARLKSENEELQDRIAELEEEGQGKEGKQGKQGDAGMGFGYM